MPQADVNLIQSKLDYVYLNSKDNKLYVIKHVFSNCFQQSLEEFCKELFACLKKHFKQLVS